MIIGTETVIGKADLLFFKHYLKFSRTINILSLTKLDQN